MERLSDISTIKEILSRHGFSFSRGLGQNFLINPSVCPKMAEAAVVGENVGVLEIGPGIGVLTGELCRLSEKVVAVEIDRRLIPVLAETLSDFDNVKVINDDILKIDINKLIEQEYKGMRVVVCANLPYYITSPVIMRLLEERLPVESITVMVQREAAQRICAQIGTRQSGAVTVAVNYYSKPRILFSVSAGSFMPAPKVDSAVIKLDILPKPAVDARDSRMFFRVVKAAFGQRRKTLSNSLSSGLGTEKSEISRILAECGISPLSRAEQLSLEDFKNIADTIGEV